MKDPFLEMYKKMKEASEEVLNKNTSFFIAKITKPLPNIELMLNDVPLDKDDILIDSNLLKLNEANVTCSTGSINHNLKDTLNMGDQVILLKINDKFALISKVVSL